jgi:nicotinate phosphoribosyltransferase
MNQVHLQTVVASKAHRLVTAARGRRIVDFGMRRLHGSDAALGGARVLHCRGRCHEQRSEADPFRNFAAVHPESILLVDTYDTLEGVRRVVRLAEELGADFRVRGIRLDSGSPGELARRCRTTLDDAGLEEVEIVASGSLDEDEIARLLAEGAPIAGFGVGTRMGVSSDAPALDVAYKLTAYAGRGRMKLSPPSGYTVGCSPALTVYAQRVAGEVGT